MRASILLAAIVPLTFATPIIERATNNDAKNIVDAVNGIQAKITDLTKSLNNFQTKDPKGIPKVLVIQFQVEALGLAVQNATKAANKSKKLSLDDSGTVAGSVLNLQSNIDPLLDLIVSKKPAFDSAVLGTGSVTPQVRKDLQDEKSFADTFGAALTKKLDPQYQAIAPSIIQQIDDSFDRAIAAFAKAGGLFSLPVLPSYAAFKAELSKYGPTS